MHQSLVTPDDRKETTGKCRKLPMYLELMRPNLDVLGPPTKADAAYLELRNQILLGVLEPGSRVDQGYLSELFGLSITPLREALRRLEADHLVIRSAHRGVVIAPLSQGEAVELLTVRESLDVLGVRLAVENMTAAELASAIDMVRSPDDSWAIAYLRAANVPVAIGGPLTICRAFYRMVYCGSHNEVLIQCRDAISARTERYAIRARQLREDDDDSCTKRCEGLIAALSERDAAHAESEMRTLYRGEGFNFADVIFGARIAD